MNKVACIMLIATLAGCSTTNNRDFWVNIDADELANSAVQECSKNASNKMISEQDYVKCMYFNYGLLVGYKYRILEE